MPTQVTLKEIAEQGAHIGCTGLIIHISVESIFDCSGTITSIERCRHAGHEVWDVLQVGMQVGIPKTMQSFEVAAMFVDEFEVETIYPPSDLLIIPDVSDDEQFQIYCEERNKFLIMKYGG